MKLDSDETIILKKRKFSTIVFFAQPPEVVMKLGWYVIGSKNSPSFDKMLYRDRSWLAVAYLTNKRIYVEPMLSIFSKDAMLEIPLENIERLEKKQYNKNFSVIYIEYRKNNNVDYVELDLGSADVDLWIRRIQQLGFPKLRPPIGRQTIYEARDAVKGPIKEAFSKSAAISIKLVLLLLALILLSLCLLGFLFIYLALHR